MKLQTLISILHQFGLKNCLFRVGYQRRKKKGYFERIHPTFDWETLRATSIFLPGEIAETDSLCDYLSKKVGRFFFELGKPVRLAELLDDSPAREWQGDAIRRAERLAEGWFPYFSKLEGKLGTPGPQGLPEIDWFLNPFTGQRDTKLIHWSKREDFDPDRGDIKYIWEPARFAWVYDLVRAYSATGDDRYPVRFWHLLHRWMQANPPSIGPGWQCGQEVAIRVMAVCFGLWAFWDHPSTNEQNVLDAVRLLATSGYRIEVNLDYAKSQRSNHSSTESLGLLMLGLLFPTMRHADRWEQIGRRTLEHDARVHFRSDGSYLMHSLNYQRMTMHCFLWAMRLAELADAPFADEVYEKMGRAARLLYQLQEESGRVPNYGSNDGALLCPLSGCDYLDYRPMLTAMFGLLDRRGKPAESKQQDSPSNLLSLGPAAEESLWLLGSAEKYDLPKRVSSQFPVGGYYTLRSERSWLMTRCHAYRSRPSQADELHVDLWCDGVNVLRDPGTFQYYDPEQKRNLYFISTAAHNTIEVDGQSQMEKGPRFYWKSLCQGKVLKADETTILAEHYGYRRLGVVHRREIRLVAPDRWQVKDRLIGGTAETRWKLSFHLPDVACSLEGATLTVEKKVPGTFCRNGPEGALHKRVREPFFQRCTLRWQSDAAIAPDLLDTEESLYYGHLAPAKCLTLSGTGGDTEIVWDVSAASGD